MSAIRASVSRMPRRIMTVSSPASAAARHGGAKRHYINTPFNIPTSPMTSSGLPIIFAGSGAAGVIGMGLYALGKDSRGIQHSDHQAQQELNPKRKYRDSTSTRWVDWHTKQ